MWIVQAAPLPLLSWEELLGLSERLSGALIALAFFVGLMRGWFVLKSEFEEMKRERDEWKQMYREERATHTREG